MKNIGIISFQNTITSLATHQSGEWIDGWNLNTTGDNISFYGDLTGDNKAEFVIQSDWGIGIVGFDGNRFHLLYGCPRDSVFTNSIGSFRYDSTERLERDKIIAVDYFTSSEYKEILLLNETGLTMLKFNGSSFEPTRLMGLRTEQKILDGINTKVWGADFPNFKYHGSGYFDDSGDKSLLIEVQGHLHVLSPNKNQPIYSLAREKKINRWTYRPEKIESVLISDFDGDNHDEIFIHCQNEILILKLIQGNLQVLAHHKNGGSIPGFSTGFPNRYPAADKFTGSEKSQILAFNDSGLYALELSNGILQRKAFVKNGGSISGWALDWSNNTFLSSNNVLSNDEIGIIVRSPWGIGIINLQENYLFTCETLVPYGEMLGEWSLKSSDIILGADNFFNSSQNDLLIIDPWAGFSENPDFIQSTFVNWHGNIRKSIKKYNPSNLSELIVSIKTIEQNNEQIGIKGSGWSYSNCVVDNSVQSMIDTSELNNSLNKLLPHYIDNRIPESKNKLVHVEAGIKIYELNCRLEKEGLALATMGGSRGQSLAGAMSTGTHGSDHEIPPITDWVRAIQLIGTNGQEWWVEPADRRISSRIKMEKARAQGVLDPKIKIIYNNDLFNSLLVSMGCAGIIYSVVVECRPSFNLRQDTITAHWSEASNWISKMYSLGLDRPNFLEINVNPSNDSCKFIVRKETREPVDLSGSSSSGTEISFCEAIAAASFIGPALTPIIAGYVGKFVAEESIIVTAALSNPFTAVIVVDEIKKNIKAVEDLGRFIGELGLSSLHCSSPDSVAKVLPAAINLIWHLEGFLKEGLFLIDNMQSSIINGQRPDGTKINKSYKIMTGQPSCSSNGDQVHPATERLVQSYEYSLPLDQAIDFINNLVKIVKDLRRGNDAIVVNFNLRFTGKTRATLGMQQYDKTCMVEIYIFKGVDGNQQFLSRMHQVVKQFKALPHWGQLHNSNEANNFSLASRRKWAKSMKFFANGRETFFTNFVRERGLLN